MKRIRGEADFERRKGLQDRTVGSIGSFRATPRLSRDEVHERDAAARSSEHVHGSARHRTPRRGAALTSVLRLANLIRAAPLTSIYLISWACGYIGLALDLNVNQGTVGAIWRNLIGPAYAVGLLGTMLGAPFPLWTVLALGPLLLADLGLHRLRRRRKEQRSASPGRA